MKSLFPINLHRFHIEHLKQNLVAHTSNNIRIWANENNACFFTRLSKIRSLGKKTIARVDSINFILQIVSKLKNVF